MKKRRSAGTLSIWQNGQQVGRLSRESTGAIHFQYDDVWLAAPNAFPISLSLPLRNDRFSGDTVLAVFDNLLPDNDRIRRHLAERARAEGQDTFSLLEAIGRDCVGALQFLPEDENPPESGVVNSELLSETDVADLLENLSTAPLGVDVDGDFRISIAGAQEKTALLYTDCEWRLPHGATATTHILKPQIGKLSNGLDLSNSVENEHFCMRLLADLGLPMAATQIVDFDDIRALAIERFDRLWTDDSKLLRRPQEDCCQALGVSPAVKYEADGGPGVSSILELLSGSDNSIEDQYTFLKAQICFWLISAIDGHGKNFSIYLGKQGRFRLSPLYDVMSAEPLFAAKQISKNQMKLAMCFGDKRRYRVDMITKRHFVQSATKARMPVAIVDKIIAEVQRAMDKAVNTSLTLLPDDFSSDIADVIVNTFLNRIKQLGTDHTL